MAAYLVDTEDGVTVIDAGLPGHWKELLAELDAMGRSTADIRGLVLTHGDNDHIGFAERLRREHGVPVYVHSADAERARSGDKAKVSMGPARLRPMLGFLTYSMGTRGWRTTYLSEVTEVADDPELAVASLNRLSGVDAVWVLPGHGARWRGDPATVQEQVQQAQAQ